MGTMRDSVVWKGAYVNGSNVKGAYVNGKRFYGSGYSYLMIWTYINDTTYTTMFKTFQELIAYIETNAITFKSIKLISIDNKNLTDISYLFYGCPNLESIDLSDFDMSNVTKINHMCYGCQKLKTLDLSNFDTSKVTDMSFMCYNCSSLESVDIRDFNTAELPNLACIFAECPNLKTIYCNNNWDRLGYVDNLITTADMFKNCNMLVGAVPFDSKKISILMANPDTGYFTRK